MDRIEQLVSGYDTWTSTQEVSVSATSQAPASLPIPPTTVITLVPPVTLAYGC